MGVLQPVIPDGGYGWVIVIGSFLVHVFADGFVYSFGIMVKDIEDEFHSTNAEMAIIISLLTGLTLGCGPLASAVTNKFGCRTSTIVGSIIATCGCVLAHFATSIVHIILAVGVVMGIGVSLMYCPAIVIVTMYFESKRALATGLAVCGAGFGTFIFPFIYGEAKRAWGWRGVFLVAAGFMAACAGCGASFRPLQFVEESEKSESTERKDDIEAKDSVALLAPPASKIKATSEDAIHLAGKSPLKAALSVSDVEGSPRKRSETISEGYMKVKGVLYTGSITNVHEYQENPQKFRSLHSLGSRLKLDEVKEEDDNVFEEPKTDSGLMSCMRGFIDPSLLIEPTFVLFAVSNLLTSVGFNSPLYFLPKHATEGLLLTDKEGDFALSVFGVCNTVGRISFGLVGDKKLPLPRGWGDDTRRNRLWIYAISLSLCGILTALCFQFTSYISLCVYAGAFGFSISSYICLTSVILVDLLGLEKLTNAFGLLLLFQGIGTVFGPPLIGYLADITHNYNWSFAVCGFNLLLSGVIMFLTPLLRPAASAPKGDSPGMVLH